jgi:DNA-binding GntR family transcriptional regulator
MEINDAAEDRTMDGYGLAAARVNSAGMIADRLRMGIILHKYAPGDRLIEMDLTGEFSVSRTTVRTALQTLESEGMIRMLPNGGKEVVGFSRQYANDLYDLREMLECKALERSVEGSPDYTPMLSVLTQIDLADGTDQAAAADDFADLDMRYHRAIMMMSRSLPLLRSWETTAPMMRAILNLNNGEDYRERYVREFSQKHKIILDLIIQKKYDAVEQMRRHIRDACDMSLKRLEVLWDQ